jgi:hypothetical protein
LHIIVLIPNVASDVKNIILWSSRYPHFRELYGTDVDYTRIPFSSLSPMSQKTFITAAQKANVSERHESLDVALRNDNLSAWVALVLSRMTRIETLHLSIPSEWPGIFPVRLFENTDSSIPGGAPRSPALRDVHIQQLDRRPSHLHGVELVSLFLILPSLRTFCHNGPLGQHFTLKLEWFIGQSLVENVTFTRLHSEQANIESILLSFKALCNFYISYETQSWFGEIIFLSK